MSAHRLVNIHSVQARRVETREPHIPHQHDLKRIAGVSEPLGKLLPPGLVPDVWLPIQWVGGRAGHHNLYRAFAVIIVVPVWAQEYQLPVELNADAAAHADDHRLSFQSFQPQIEVGDNVLCNLLHTLLRTDHRLKLCPLGLETLPSLHLLSLGGLLELRVDVRFLVFIEGQLSEAALVVDGHRGPVLDGTLDVVDTDVVTKNSPCVGVLKLDGRT